MPAEFKVIQGNLSQPGGHDDYAMVMQDIYVDKTGRYELVGEARTSVDPTCGDMMIIIEVLDHGQQPARPPKY
jgi:hypothetical protein